MSLRPKKNFLGFLSALSIVTLLVIFTKGKISDMAELNFAKYGKIVQEIQRSKEDLRVDFFGKYGKIIEETPRAEVEKPVVTETQVETKPSETFEQALIERLIGLEQFRDTAYRATKDEEFLTIGYGHYGSDVKENQKITQEDALNLLRSDIAERLPAIKEAIPVFDELSLPLRVEIAQSWFRGGMSGSPKTIGLINEGKFVEASTEFLNNEEYRTARKRGRAGIIPRMQAVSLALKEEGK